MCMENRLTLITANLKENVFKFNRNGSCIKHESCKGPSGHHTRVVSKVSTIAMSVMN